VESVILTLAAAASGLLLARFLLDLLLTLAPADIPRLSSVAIDSRVLTATLAVCVLVSLVFGVLPSLQVRQLDLHSSLKLEAGRASAGRQRRGLRSTLVISELALATMLVIGAGLLINSFWRLQQVDPGFRTEGVLKAEFQLPATRYSGDRASYPNWPAVHRFKEALVRHAEILPGVESVAIAGNHPLDVGFTNSFVVVGREAEARTWPEISIRWVTPGYFRTLRVPLLDGRVFEDKDGTLAAPVLLINDEARRRFFADRNPLGQQIRFWGLARTIVGVVGNEKIHGLAVDTPPAAYSPMTQAAWLGGSLLVRVRGEPNALTRTLRAAFRSLDPAVTVFGVEPLEETLSRSLAQKRFTMLLLAMFGALALFLAALGIYGVLSYSVEQRTREIGIRSALGARSGDLLRLILGQAILMAGIGLTTGLIAALALSRVLRNLLYGVSPTDFSTFAIVSALLAVVALAASYLPARRATRVDPIIALRYE
jgi:putative ABC transport system permease protein